MSLRNQYTLPDGREAVFGYRKRKPVVVLRQIGNILYTSGHGPEDQITGKPVFRGRIGEDLTPEEGYAAARECGAILINAMREYLGTLDRVKSIVKATALVNAGNDFYEIDKVMDGFSDLMADVFEERGYHARTVMGTHNLPNTNIPVEVELIAEIF
ncbi:RidA family protein [Breznakiella homolactica]|uniref:RidA family protein n=1 Tax=Breznakiella homolactica TaxID=2798577 RepID=A0A7T8BDG7_9SPIR|nr:RidA family protein [Breznakiella homolactica]QQO11238.1 RidA family protein [Breznakiella homolactica]